MASRSGVMGDIDAMAVAMAVWRLGAEEANPATRCKAGAGLYLHRRSGEPVAAGETLFTLYTETPERLPSALARLDGGWSVADAAPPQRPVVLDRIE